MCMYVKIHPSILDADGRPSQQSKTKLRLQTLYVHVSRYYKYVKKDTCWQLPSVLGLALVRSKVNSIIIGAMV